MNNSTANKMNEELGRRCKHLVAEDDMMGRAVYFRGVDDCRALMLAAIQETFPQMPYPETGRPAVKGVPAVIQSAFQFKDGTRIIVYAGAAGIRTFFADESWIPTKKYAEAHGWERSETPLAYHLRIRQSNIVYDPGCFVQEHSTDLGNQQEAAPEAGGPLSNGELFYQRGVMNPYPGESQSHTAYDKGFTEAWEHVKTIIVQQGEATK